MSASEIVWRGATGKAKPGEPNKRLNDSLGAHYEGSTGVEGLETTLLSVDAESVRPIAFLLLQDTTYPSGRVGGGPLVNGAARARVSYTAGLSGRVSFDCDWTGGATVLGQRLEVSRVGYNPDPISGAYGECAVKLAVTAALGAARPACSLQYTVPPAAVAIAATRLIAIPAYARRVQLLTIYGNGGASGDAPLGQLFLAFVSSNGGVLHWIDALSSREALFGEGLSIPAGAVSLALSNRSADASVCLGSLFHLSV